MVDTSNGIVHFLFAEDDPLLVGLYVDAFKFSGYVLKTAKDGEEALMQLKAATPKPSALLLDIAMPKLTGLEVLERMRADESLKHIPVIALSNLADEETEHKAKALGVLAYLVKSDYTPSQVVEKVVELVKNKTA